MQEKLTWCIVFIQDRRGSGKWLAILSTDLTISPQEIVRIYGYRWDIEVCFRVCKSYLNLAKEFQGRSYDMMVAHSTIVLIRYCILALALREDTDERTIGDLFYSVADEVKKRSFFKAMKELLSMLRDFLSDKLSISKQLIEQAIDEFFVKITFPLFKPPEKVCES